MIKTALFYSLLFLSSNSICSTKINYTSPSRNSKFVKKESSIIIGLDNIIDKNSLTTCTVTVTGSKSGQHNGKIILSEDNNKILFKPDNPYMLGEKITVTLNNDLKDNGGVRVSGFSYSFYTETQSVEWNPSQSFLTETDNIISTNKTDTSQGPPNLTVTISNNPSPGKIFLSNLTFNTSDSYLIISENTGLPYYYRGMNARILDFKKQPNGNLTYYNQTQGKYYELNTNYVLIDSFYCGNGYTTDEHELRILNNGHALLMSYDPEIVDMSQYIEGGNTHATVVGLIIQEIDQYKNVVFQWRSWDHFLITDATHENLLSDYIDYVHGNAIEIDNDNNLLISSRHMDEITKINRITGQIIWRLGGRDNQFTFINDPIRFSHQHAIRRINNGHITLYDNGNFHSPPFSRAVEYSLDEINRTATLEWQYRHNPDIYGFAMGYVQRLNSGNTLISWGAANPTITITEVTPGSTIALEINLPNGIYTYRAFKDNWGDPVFIQPASNELPGKFELEQNYPNPFNSSTIIKFNVPFTSDVSITLYNVLGTEVQNIFTQRLNRGNYSVSLDVSNLSSGIYFYRLQSGSFSVTKKMSLIK